MDEVLLIEAVERYVKGEMTSQERSFFEEVRKNTPEVDQMVVEHTYFLNGLNDFAAVKTFKNILSEVDNKLTRDGVIVQPEPNGEAKVVSLWHRYKRNIAVAASIAGFISLLVTGLNIAYNNKTKQTDLINLRREMKKTITEEIGTRIRQIPAAPNKPVKQPIPENPAFGGTGFLIDGKGYLITNAHVVSKLKNIYVENGKGNTFNADVLFTDYDVDLAILKISDTSYKTIATLPYSVKRANSDLGEQFFTLGFPRNEIVYGEGYVSAKSGSNGDSAAYQLTVSANPGNSGGPVINRNGEIIGIITAKDSKADGVVYATKSRNIFKLLDNLKKDDENAYTIKTPSNNGLKGLDRIQQVKKMEEFVFMVVGN